MAHTDIILAIAIVLSTCFTIVLLTLPSRVVRPSKANAKSDSAPSDKLVQIVVLGDIGRSPRMQYHALSLAKHHCRVNLTGILDSDVHPAILSQPLITIVPTSTCPTCLQTTNKLFVLLLAPLKAIHQAICLYYVLAYTCQPADFILLQNPPSIPTFLVCSFIALVRGSKLVIDWHNLGYSLYALKFGPSHPLVHLHRSYEFLCAKLAYAHLTVTHAMARFLKENAGILAYPLHDRPPSHFQPYSAQQRVAFLSSFSLTAARPQNSRLLVSSTSWTPDEDFSLLLDGLVLYSTRARSDPSLPYIVTIITGNGPLKHHYLSIISSLEAAGRLSHAEINTAWLSSADYASLLASADLGASLHTSSSGLDLPMKVVDMFGAGLPVVGWSKFEAWTELVREGENGCGFVTASDLSELLIELFHPHNSRLHRMREQVMSETTWRWDDEWNPVARRLFELTA